MGRRVSDEFAVPLCRTHHRAVHRHGDEVAWWKSAGIDPAAIAQRLWQHTRLNGAPIQEHLDPLLWRLSGLAFTSSRNATGSRRCPRPATHDRNGSGPKPGDRFFFTSGRWEAATR